MYDNPPFTGSAGLRGPFGFAREPPPASPKKWPGVGV